MTRSPETNGHRSEEAREAPQPARPPEGYRSNATCAEGSAPSAVAPMAALMTADQVAEVLSVSRDWVYDHAVELGAVRLGNLIRFVPERLAEVRTSGFGSREPEVPSEPVVKPQRRRRGREGSGTGPKLVPIRAPEVPHDA